MSDLTAKFEEAADAVQNLTQMPSNAELLELYGLYKQGSTGDCTGKRPGMLDLKGRAKYDAWKAFEGTSQDDAKQQYVELVASLKEKYG